MTSLAELRAAAPAKVGRKRSTCKRCGDPGQVALAVQLRELGSRPTKTIATKYAVLCEPCAITAWDWFVGHMEGRA